MNLDNIVIRNRNKTLVYILRNLLSFDILYEGSIYEKE
ncbi:hypothetical protein SDC9_165007 [bioreactor metagenome]|uniref:Uncharacterized protein n=1 Tax=bioreactor metagenome TaxID=1076179 RepID=A0A645FVH8_9ZZZZ